MGKKGKKMIMVLLIMGLSISATGCKGIMKEEPDATKGVKNDGDLEGIYIKNDSKFYKPVTENQTFNSSTYEPNADRVVWYTGTSHFIPTVDQSKGNKIVFFSKEEIPSSFNIEEFKDLGYTIGLRAVYADDKGDYKFKVASNVLASSDLYEKIYDKDGPNYFLNTINDSKIKKDNFTYAGTIAGLEKGKDYKIGIYKGTYLIEQNVKADTKIFASYKVMETEDYEKTKKNYIVIKMPKKAKKGYYSINESGIFYYKP